MLILSEGFKIIAHLFHFSAVSSSMNKQPLLALILTACIGATASVHAQDASGTAPATPPAEHKLRGIEKEFDTDHDGKLSDTEKAAMIAKYDKNGNGKIDKDELPPKKPKKDHPKDGAGQGADDHPKDGGAHAPAQ
jgi:hypothetical protein